MLTLHTFTFPSLALQVHHMPQSGLTCSGSWSSNRLCLLKARHSAATGMLCEKAEALPLLHALSCTVSSQPCAKVICGLGRNLLSDLVMCFQEKQLVLQPTSLWIKTAAALKCLKPSPFTAALCQSQRLPQLRQRPQQPRQRLSLPPLG